MSSFRKSPGSGGAKGAARAPPRRAPALAEIGPGFGDDRSRIVDPETGEVTGVELWVMVLGASNYTYAEATATQSARERRIQVPFNVRSLPCVFIASWNAGAVRSHDLPGEPLGARPLARGRASRRLRRFPLELTVAPFGSHFG